MSRLRFLLLIVPVLVVCSGFARAQQTAMDLDGHTVNPLAADSGKVVVLVFLRRDCPVSSRYAPAIQQISKQYCGPRKLLAGVSRQERFAAGN